MHKNLRGLITELLFADDCALLAHTEKALQHIINQFTDAAKNFGLTISLNKTEVFQPPPHEAYSPPYISINGTNLNAVERFIYLGSIISSDAIVSKATACQKPTVPLEDSKRAWQSHLLRLYKKFQVYRAVVVPTLLCGAETWVLYRKLIRSGFTDAACAPSLASDGKTMHRTKKS